MWRKNIIVFLLSVIPGFLSAQDYGLLFNGQETQLDNRTGVHFTSEKPIVVKKDLEIEFDFSLVRGQKDYYGYFFRILDENGFNIDLLYDQKRFENNNIKLVIGQQFSDIGLSLDTNLLFNNWNKVRIAINFETNHIQLNIGNRFFEDNFNSSKRSSKIEFVIGANNLVNYRSTDVPSMKVKDVKVIVDKKLKYHWPLNNISGTSTYDIISNTKANVMNPVWIQSSSEEWKNELDFKGHGTVVSAFNKEKDLVYIVSPDKFLEYNIHTKKTKVIDYEIPHKIKEGAGLFYNPLDKQLYIYFLDNQYISAIDPQNGEWKEKDMDYDKLTIYWQTAKAFSVKDSSAYFFGGYGQLNYRNDLKKYHFPTKTWQNIPIKNISPRYLSSIAVVNDTLYIYGGYGSDSGNQMINPKYNFDLYSSSIYDYKFSKLSNISNAEKDFVPVNSLVFIKDSRKFYSLIFSNYKLKTNLQLVNWSEKDSKLEEVGDVIPYIFKDIKSYADLFITSDQSKLIALNQYKDDQDSTQLGIYSIAFPPNISSKAGTFPLLKVLILCAFVVVVYAIYIRRKKGQKTEKIENIEDGLDDRGNLHNNSEISIDLDRTESLKYSGYINLFGGFEVTVSPDNIITKKFTPLIKELFLLILIYSLRDNGISSKEIDKILWFDKTQKDARNNRSVNLAKLRNLLEEVGNVSISNDTGNWKVLINDDIYIDFQEYLQIASNRKLLSDISHINAFLSIVARGGFLDYTHYTWLDKFISEIHNEITNILTEVIQNQSISDRVKENALDSLFRIDSLNESALIIKCKILRKQGKHSLAMKIYEQFTLEYKSIYNVDFPIPFNDIINN